MNLPKMITEQCRLPIICAPMFLVSTPNLVISACQNGIIGSFPALNTRPSELLDQWLSDITQALENERIKYPNKKVAPFAVNQVVHPSNSRLQADQDIIRKHEVPIVITSQGDPKHIVEDVHSWGGIVLHDVIKAEHAHKAIDAGVDGIIAVANGAGGHGGTINPFALVNEIRGFYSGPVALAGTLNSGSDVRACEIMGADMAYMGTRFIACREAEVPAAYKEMIVKATIQDIIYTDHFTGVYANYLKASLQQAGIPVEQLLAKEKVDLDLGNTNSWKDIWSAGQGVSGITNIPSLFDLVRQLEDEYLAACHTPKFEPFNTEDQ